MNRYVDKDKLLERMDDISAYYEEGKEVKDEMIALVYNFLTADAEETKHGMWVEYKYPRHDPHGRIVCMCTACEEGWDKEDLIRAGKGCLPKRCPECGAKMDEEKNE